MYDRPETAAANDALWAGIRDALGYGPDRLDRETPAWDVWQSPDLLLSQTCGMPYRTRLHGRVQLVGTPDYGLPDTPPGCYRSVFVVRSGDTDDLHDYRDRVFAYNDAGSQSGWAAAQTHADGLGFRFQRLHCSGGHRASAYAVAMGDADIAALDGVSWRLICDYDDIACELKVIAATSPTPGLPLITAQSRDADAILAAVRQALDELRPDHADILGIKAIQPIKADQYLAIATPAAP
jgi:ABC-type phosphate/phosphonate transport system substrate-binding protein